MFVEAAAIPYEASSLLGERLLVLAPHPDDEIIGCGGVVAHHLRLNRTVRVVVATAGDAAGDSVTRSAETVRGLALLGGSAPETLFLGHSDRHLGKALPELIAQLREQLHAFRPDLILAPSPIEFHPDHSALSRALTDAIAQDPSLFADLALTTIAFYEVTQPLRPNALVDITDVADAKWDAIAAHESQTDQRDYAGLTRASTPSGR